MIDDTLSNALAISRYICISNKKCVCNLCSPTVRFSRAVFSASCFLKAGILEETLKKKCIERHFLAFTRWYVKRAGKIDSTQGLRLRLLFKILLKARFTEINLNESQTTWGRNRSKSSYELLSSEYFLIASESPEFFYLLLAAIFMSYVKLNFTGDVFVFLYVVYVLWRSFKNSVLTHYCSKANYLWSRGFRSDVDQICVLLGYYAASRGNIP
jgi:hypothetical protein